MSSYLLRRLLGSIPVIVLAVSLVFLLLRLVPGDPATVLLPDNVSEQERAAMRARWGLDQPLLQQYVTFMSHALRGDLGNSYRGAQPVVEMIAQRLPPTVELALVAMLVAVLVAVPLGVVAGVRPGSAADTTGTVVGLFGISMPNFWFGIMLTLLFAGVLHILPSAGRSEYGVAGPPITGFYVLDSLLVGNWAGVADAFRHLALPAVALGTALAGILMRMTRSAVLEVTREDYVTVARAKGLSSGAVVWRHVVRNALVPVVTIVGLELGTLLSGSIIVETVFAWPGVGNLLITALGTRDYPLVTGIVLMFTLTFVLINLLVDAAYTLIDPRIRY